MLYTLFVHVIGHSVAFVFHLKHPINVSFMLLVKKISEIIISYHIISEINALEQVDTKFFGVYIDQHLTWKTHVNFIAAKISKFVGLLYKAKYYLPSKSLLTLYYALICPYLSLLQFNLCLYLCHQPSTNLPATKKSIPGDL